jgi:hypothetical protein
LLFVLKRKIIHMKQKKEDKPVQQPASTKKSNSKFFEANQRQGNDPHADRSAKTGRKGAGQQQGSSGSPINS